MTSAEYHDAIEPEEGEIDRRETGVRILLTILFGIISSLLDSVIGLVVVFCLVWALITEKHPALRLRTLVNRVIAYRYRIARYLTYNESRIPFPFSDFPEVLEDPAPISTATESPAATASESPDFDLDDDTRPGGESEDAS